MAITCALASGLFTAPAQVVTPSLPEPPVIEPIGPVTVVPGQAVAFLFPNLPDPFHRKYVYFEGSAASLDPLTPANLKLTFDWYLDQNAQGPPNFSPTAERTVLWTGTPIFVEYWIPECPPWVSLHIETDVPAVIEGVFVHQCVPEPRQYALVAALGAMVFGFARRRLRAAA